MRRAGGLARVLARAPTVLGMSGEEEGNMAKVEAVLKGPLCGLSKSELSRLVERHPAVLGLSAERKLSSCLLWLSAAQWKGGLGASKSQVSDSCK